MASIAALLSLSIFTVVSAQQVGTNTAETHPSLTWQTCTSGGCTTVNGKVVLDANWRWVHSNTGYTNCYTGNTWDATLCPDSATCVANCALDGADYSGTYGITTSGNALTLKFVTNNSNGKNIGSRTYLMKDDSTYQNFALLNQEFTFDVDVSQLPCGLNGALYFSEMALDGGMSANPTNKAGAKYGTGYCDSQCPRDLKFINGEANVDGWASSGPNSGTGNSGACCSEMDIWEANSVSAAYTPHPCQSTGISVCDASSNCEQPDRYASVCDPDGCDFNSYRMGDTGFYGPGGTVDTSSKFTVVTQFITDDGTSSGTLTEIKRVYVQNGVVIQNSNVNIAGIDVGNSITEDYCDQQKAAFGDQTQFQDRGGLATLGESFTRTAVLVMSLWDDTAVSMLWLDSDYPTDADPTTPGIARGTCATSSGVPSEVEANSGSSQVIYSNIKFGDIGSTFTGSTTTGPTTTPDGNPTTTQQATTTTQNNDNSGGAAHWGQCGGMYYSGPTNCQSPYNCVFSNDWYSQCL